MTDERVIGIIYRHGCNDYEFMIGDFPKKMRDDIESKVMAFDDGYNLAGARGDKRMCLEDANIDHFERNEWIQRYVNTKDPKDIVTLPQIFERYLAINGKVDGFEKYVIDGFVNDVGYREYVEYDK